LKTFTPPTFTPFILAFASKTYDPKHYNKYSTGGIMGEGRETYRDNI
jgi:hypothetical protein